MQPDLETRAASLGVDGSRITGYPIVFNSPSEDLGGWREIIRPEAVDRTLREALDVRALVDHDTAKVLGRTKAGTLRLQKDSRGLLVTIDPPNTTIGRDLLESVRRGDVSGMSFRFEVVKPGGERFEQRDAVPHRIISDMRIFEVSVCTFPAYTATDVAVAVRSLQVFQAANLAPRASVSRRQQQHRVRIFLGG